MTSLTTLQLKAIQTIIESVDIEDKADSDQAMRLIKALLQDAEKKA